MSFKEFSQRTQLVFVLVLGMMFLLIYLIIDAQKNLRDSETNRYNSVNLANLLFRSSEDLTRMARAYVVTGDVRYKKNYQRILDIRRGKQKRPLNYNNAYWYLHGLKELDNLSHAEHGDNTSFDQLVIDFNYTDQELGYLILSKEESDLLVALERQAFYLIEESRRYLPKRYLQHETNLRTLALDMLYNTTYMKAKENIVKPIQRLTDSVNKRTLDSMVSYQYDLTVYSYLLWALVVLSILGKGFEFIYITKTYIDPLKQLSETDSMTGLLNRRKFIQVAEDEFRRATRTGRSFSLLMIDVDFFKRINDTYGHEAGDEVLIKLAQLFLNNIREIDVACRWGGEEFILMMVEIDEEGTQRFAERLRSRIMNSMIDVKGYESIQITISVGIAVFDQHKKHDDNDINNMINMADRSLYTAKHSGRNKVVVA